MTQNLLNLLLCLERGHGRFGDEFNTADFKNCDPSPGIKREDTDTTMEWRSNEARYAGSATARKRDGSSEGQPAC